MTKPRQQFFLALSSFVLLIATSCGTPLPDGIKDTGADALAHRMQDSVDAEAWKRTGAITWTFNGSANHLWDRRRGFARVRKGDLEVWINLGTREGIATDEGKHLEGEEHREALEDAYGMWANDSFWLTAMNKAFDPGTTRSLVIQDDGREALLVQYSSGGVTPGDAYLWHLDNTGRPTSWQMWVSIIPIDGISATWGDWIQLPTGAYVSTSHDIGPITIDISDLDAAETLADLVKGPDPFEPIVSSLND